MIKTVEQLIEPVLWQSRFIILLAVLSSLLGALVLVAIGVADVVQVFLKIPTALHSIDAMDVYQTYAIGNIIAAVDVFLIATVLLIFGIGLYELFISRLEIAKEGHHARRVLGVKDLDDLKERLAKVVVMALVVAFFKIAIGLKVQGVVELLLFGLAILAASGALLLNRGKSEK
jgi:uncharacterized membrane protein YqhA